MSIDGVVNIGEKDVPVFLRSSPFFMEAFDCSEQGDNNITIPVDCFKVDPHVNSDDELNILCKTVRFWLIPEYLECSKEVFGYILSRKRDDSDQLFDQRLAVDMPILEKLKKATVSNDPNTVMREAVKQDLAGLVEHIHSSGYAKIVPETASLAAEYGSLNTLKSVLAHQAGVKITRSLARLAANGGHLDCLKYLHLNGCPIDIYTCQAAAMGDQLLCLAYLIEECNISIALCRSVLSHAASSSVECLNYLFDKGCQCDMSAAVCAAEAGNLECLKCLSENGVQFTHTTTISAASSGHLDCLTYIVEHGGMLSLRAMSQAALGGHLDCLAYLHSVECGWSVNTCRAAAARGHLNCLVYLHEHGCPWNERTTALAAQNEHEPCLLYALQHGCPIGPEVTMHLSRVGDLTWLQQLHAQGQCASWNEQTCIAAIRVEGFECLKFAVQQGCPVGIESCAVAAQLGQLHTLQFLHESGCQWDASTCEAAQRLDSVECLSYALQHGCPYEWDYTVNMQAPKCTAYLRERSYW